MQKGNNISKYELKVFSRNKKMLKKVVEEIINLMKEKKELIWRKPWVAGLPKSGLTGKPYQGFNLIKLYMLYGGGKFYTLRQIEKKGWKLKEDAKGVLIVYWNYFEKEIKKKVKKKKLVLVKKNKLCYWEEVEDYDEVIETKTLPFVRVYEVYHESQILDNEGRPLPPSVPKIIDDSLKIEEIENVISNYIRGANLKVEQGWRACYIPAQHKIVMPPKSSFRTIEGYYETFLHELAHSTKKFIKRKIEEDWKESSAIEKYSYEELVAEISAALLCSIFGIFDKTKENNAAYVQGWLKSLEEKPLWLYKAAEDAFKAVRFILKFTPNNPLETITETEKEITEISTETETE